jgi:hypothetical protein
MSHIAILICIVAVAHFFVRLLEIDRPIDILGLQCFFNGQARSNENMEVWIIYFQCAKEFTMKIEAIAVYIIRNEVLEILI